MEITIQPPKVTEYLEVDGSGRVEVVATWKISPQRARVTAGRIAGEHVSLLLYGTSPDLVVGERVTWRVPIMLRLHEDDTAEVVGYVSIDANTGEPVFGDADLAQITIGAERHAQRSLALAVAAD